MPLARIDLIEGKSAECKRTIADVVYEPMATHLGVPEGRFQVISEHKPGNLIVDLDYLGDPPFRERRVPPAGVPERRDPGAEAQLLQGVVGELNTRLQLRTEDVFFNLQTVEPADWSMGSGDVPYADGVPADRLNPDSVPADFTWPDPTRA